MKHLLIILGMCVVLNYNARAQKVAGDSASNKSNHFAIGYNLNDFGQDFGIGLNLTSPYFFHKTMAIRVSENYQQLNHVHNSGKYIWTGYHNVRLGMVSGGFILNNVIRLYGEGGVVMLISPASITATDLQIGGYGNFGIEFFITKGYSYFIELGGIGTGATAEKVLFSPIYSNGFMSSVGFRIYL